MEQIDTSDVHRNEAIESLLRFYGNCGFIADLIFSVLIFALAYFVIPLSPNKSFFTDSLISSLLPFLGVLLGFILTAYSFLMLFNPDKQSEKLNKLKASRAFKKILKSYIMISLIALVCSGFLFSMLIEKSFFIEFLSFFFLVLLFFRTIKGIYYLFAIIDFI